MSFMNFMPIAIMGIFCLVGLFAIALIGAIVAVAVWGLKHWNARVVTGERNFDDFGH